ncbi:MAG: HAMP domain-containing sensor histidine kinase [Candidatus Thiodiazotropha sp. (ex. Lucinoma kazani)]
MSRASMTGLNKKRLRLWLALFFLALAVPTAILIHQAYSELKWETFHQHRLQAEALAARIDGRFMQLINTEEARPFTDYAFLNIAGDPSANFIQRSPLSAYPLNSKLPGLIGYFQVDAQGIFTTPLLPPSEIAATDYGIAEEERKQREHLVEQIQQILSENQLVEASQRDDMEGGQEQAPPLLETLSSSAGSIGTATGLAEERIALDSGTNTKQDWAEPESVPQAAFDQLNSARPQQQMKQKRPAKMQGRIEDLQLDDVYRDEAARSMTAPYASQVAPVMKKQTRRERSILPEPDTHAAPEAGETQTVQPTVVRIRTFESEIDPFDLSLLDSGHFVLFRKVWRDGQRYIQGALIDPQVFLSIVVKTAFDESVLSRMSELILAHQEDVIATFTGQISKDYTASAEAMTGTLLHKDRLSAPLNDLALIFTIQRLPLGPGSTVIIWVAAVLILVLCGGFFLMYRLGVRQIELVRQQQDFVSAVSHELKTPLTSIRMYGEILQEGWASEEKKKTYYDYIHDESERLSRLISNVLQLARMTRNNVQLNLQGVAVSQLMDNVYSKISSQIEQAGFKLNLNCEEAAAQAIILIDADTFTQIIINLVDNAIKFAATSERKEIDLSCHLQRDGALSFAVRDYGPGVPKAQMKKIFKLFYRSENELTRETVGTGIGLALVQQLTMAMQGRVEVINKAPGAEFRVRFSTLEKTAKQ